MKNLRLLTLCFMLFCVGTITAQKNSYLSLKETYSEKDFKRLQGQPAYSPTSAGLSSLIYSGVGHFYVDEPQRAWRYMGAELIADGLIVATSIPTFMVIAFNYNPENPVMTLLTMGSILYLVSAPYIVAIIRTLSFIDAVKIAKIKSVAYPTTSAKPISWQLLPDIKYDHVGMNTHAMVGGLSLTVTF